MNRTRRLLLAIALPAVLLVALVGYCHLAGSARAAVPKTPLEVACLLEKKGMQFRLVAHWNRSIYFSFDRPLAQLGNDLTKTDKSNWQGIILCELTSTNDYTEGPRCFRYGPLLFYGDPELLERIRELLD